MKHYEQHTFAIDFCTKTLGDNRKELHKELSLFLESWPNAQVHIGTNYVSIGYSNKSNTYDMAYGAAEQFRHAVKRHAWWKELE